MNRILSVSAVSILSAGLIMALIFPAYAFAPDTDIANSNASFLGELPGDYAGFSIASSGDVNGDGFDDILIGADENDESAYRAGQAYLIFGKESGWSMDSNLANAAGASFLGERANHRAGFSVAFAGDVNGDGYDDILIGAPYYDTGG